MRASVTYMDDFLYAAVCTAGLQVDCSSTWVTPREKRSLSFFEDFLIFRWHQIWYGPLSIECDQLVIESEIGMNLPFVQGLGDVTLAWKPHAVLIT